jgi:hypothetical protein
LVRNERELYDTAQYIINNPYKRWPDLKDYRWVECFDMS